MKRQQRMVFKGALFLMLAGAAFGCRSVSADSEAKSIQKEPVVKFASEGSRDVWSVRMGLAFADAGKDGVRVAGVEPAHFANAIGLKAGDVLVALNGTAVRSAGEFETVAKSFAGNGPVAAKWDGVWEFKISRGGAEKTIRHDRAYDCDPYVLVGCGPLNP